MKPKDIAQELKQLILNESSDAVDEYLDWHEHNSDLLLQLCSAYLSAIEALEQIDDMPNQAGQDADDTCEYAQKSWEIAHEALALQEKQ